MAAPKTIREPIRQRREYPAWQQYGLVVGVLGVVSGVNFLIEPVAGAHATALVFLLAVAGLALFVGRGPTFLAATLSAVIWDYVFLPPVFAFRVNEFEDGMLLLTYFVVALVLGELTARTRAQEKARQRGEEDATALYQLTRELAGLVNLDETLANVIQQVQEVFAAEIVLVLGDSPKALRPAPHPASTYELDETERQAAVRVYEYGRWAGRFTDNPMGATGLYVPLITGDAIVGVLGLKLHQTYSPPASQRQLLNAFARQIALAIDRHRLRETSERARLLAESERLSKTLLNSISHEIRTPIAAIKSATGDLLEPQAPGLSPSQNAMLGEIQEATDRLDRLVGKVLDITRLETGAVKPKSTLCDVKDLVHTAVKETRKELARHRLTVTLPPELPLVPLDFVLTQQALTNLLSNAAFHTPPGTAIHLSVGVEGGRMVFIVADEGPGIAPESLPRVFDKFYRGANAATGGTGLGLSLVKGFVEAQGGTVRVENRAGSGAAFTIWLPLAKITAI